MSAPIIYPVWFYSLDIFFMSVSILVCLIIAFFSQKVFKITKEKKYLWFGLAYFLIAGAFIMRILSILIIYMKSQIVEESGYLTISNFGELGTINNIGYLFFRIGMLLGFLTLMLVILKIEDNRVINLLIYFVLITTIFSFQAFLVFYVTLALILFLIIHQLWLHYQTSRSKNAAMVITSFVLVLISQLIFLLLGFHNIIYAVGEVFQLAGFILFFIPYMLVLKYGK